MRSRPALATVIALAALSRAATLPAQSTSEPERIGPERPMVVAGVTVRLRPSQDGYVDATLAVPAERIYQALPLAFGDLGLTLQELDQPNRSLGTGQFVAPSRIGKQRMGSLVDCGVDPVGARNADSYTIALRVTSLVVRESDTRGTVRTLVQAVGRPRSNSGLEIHCPTTGRLEGMVAEAVARRLATMPEK